MVKKMKKYISQLYKIIKNYKLYNCDCFFLLFIVKQNMNTPMSLPSPLRGGGVGGSDDDMQ